MSSDIRELSDNAERLASQVLRSSSKDEALDTAISAADTLMKALRIVRDPNEKARLSTRFKQLLEEAELIKRSKNWQHEIGSLHGSLGLSSPEAIPVTKFAVKVLREPVSSNVMSKAEQILLLKAGYLSGFKFPPWTSSPSPAEFERGETGELFT